MNFTQFAHAHGLIIDRLVMGKIARCRTSTHRSKQNGAYYYAGDWGWLQNWQTDEDITIWKDDAIAAVDISKQIKESKKKYVEDRAKLNQEAAKKARWILGQCRQEISSYLGRKGFPDMSSNMWFKDDADPLLVIPMYIKNSIAGCQLISQDGSKKFLRGQATKNAYFQIGNGEKVFFVEGYASALSLQKILSSLRISNKIVVCFSAGNLARMATGSSGFVVADNDESGAGKNAALQSGCDWWMPPESGTDINDYHLDAGIFKVSQDLRKSIFTKAV